MAVDRTVGAQYADRIITMYVQLEMQLAEIIARGVKSNAVRDDLSQKLLALSEVRRSAEAALRKLDGKLAPAVRAALHDAAVVGGRAAQVDLLKIRDKRAVGRRVTQLDRNLVNNPSLLRLAAALSPALESRLRATHLQVVRSVGDIYQHAVAAMAAPGVLAGVTTRREASQVALDHLWQKGVTGFVDKAGRNWNLASYVEMATRTATAQAAVQAHLDELAQSDINLVMVSADGAPCPVCRPWEGKVLTTGSTAGTQHISRPSELTGVDTAVHVAGSVSEATGAGLFHPSCFVGDTLVSSPSAIRAVDRRWYEGKLIVIHTASGQKLTGTPNHPILTPEGWVPLGALHVGQHVLRSTVGVQREDSARSGMSPYDHQVPARIGDVFDALRQTGGMTSVRVPASPEQFHGDGGDGYVDVVFADSLLRNGAQPGVFDGVDQQHLVTGSAGHGGLPRGSAVLKSDRIGDTTADGIVRGSDLSSAPSCAHGRPFARLSLAAADLGISLNDPSAHGGLGYAENGRQLVLTLAGTVEIDQIVDVKRRQAACHVYNLQTVDGFYAASKVIVHNCRHTLVAFLPGLTTPASTAGDGADVYRAEQQQRRMEREARRIAVAQAGAVDPARQRDLGAQYRAKRAEIAQHVKDNPRLRRKTERERIDLGHTPSAPKTAPPKPPAPPRPKPEPAPPPRPAPKPEPKPEVQVKPKPAPAPKVSPMLGRVTGGDQARRERAASTLDAQARIVPKTIEKLAGVVIQTNRELLDDYGPEAPAGVAGFYRTGEDKVHVVDASFSVEYDRSSEELHKNGWFAHSDARAAEYYLSHETGHHVDAVLRDAPYAKRLALWHLIADRMGLPRPEGAQQGQLRDWVEKYKPHIESKVSRYGAHSRFEIMAEMWAEYTTSSSPRPYIKEIGDKIREIVEGI